MPSRIPHSHGLMAAFLAGSCVIAIGMCATTLEDTVTTDPGDVVDVPFEGLPFGTGAFEEIKHRAAGPAPTDAAAPRGEETGDAAVPTETGPPPDATVDRPGRELSPEGAGAGADRPTEAAGSGDGPGNTTEPDPPSLLDRLLALLAALVPYLLAVAVLAFLLFAARRQVAALARLVLRRGTGEERPTDVAGPRPAPDDEVSRSWYGMVEALGLEQHPAKTPTEYAADAVGTGADADDVDVLTDAFRRVRYGGAPVTEGRIARVRRALRRLGGAGDGSDGRDDDRSRTAAGGDDLPVEGDGGTAPGEGAAAGDEDRGPPDGTDGGGS